MTPSHAVVAPVVLPLLTGALLILIGRARPALAGRIGLASTAVLLALAIALVVQAAGGEVTAYLLSNWPTPFGIALALDRLSALMVLLTAVVGVVAALYARGGDDRRGAHFHALLQFQLMGLNGAFLTADLFNLFVFFEVLLIASYGLLLHGGGAARLRASVHYVAFNLAGSALFLIAVSLLYGLTGTLNMADLAERVPQAGADRTLLVQSAALLLLVVFCVKAALLPLNFWLPDTYGAASAPVAALFAIMTKVGIYAILRVTTLVFGEAGGAAAQIAAPWLGVLAMATLVLGAAGALAAATLRGLVVACVVVSAGTLLLGVGLATPASVAAALFYLVNSTLVGAAMFLLVDRLDAGPQWRTACGVLFFVFAVAMAGMPPLGGFLGKAWLIQAAGATPLAGWVIATVLASALLVLVALSRAGSRVFWRSEPERSPPTPAVAWHGVHAAALGGLLALLLAVAAFAGPLSGYAQATAAQLFSRTAYLQAVLGGVPVAAAADVRRELRERKSRSNPGGKP